MYVNWKGKDTKSKLPKHCHECDFYETFLKNDYPHEECLYVNRKINPYDCEEYKNG